MKYRMIDMETYPRRAHFDYFNAMPDPYVGVTADVDVSTLVTVCRQTARPFFLSFLYLVGRAANAVPELRQRVWKGGIIEFDTCDTSHTVLRDNGTYSFCRLDCMKPFDQFLPEAKLRHEAARSQACLDDGEDGIGLLFLSCVPWLHYTGLRQPVPTPADSNPRITWGKYRTEHGHTTLPVTLLANHALVDGFHIGVFYEMLQQELCRFAVPGDRASTTRSGAPGTPSF